MESHHFTAVVGSLQFTWSNWEGNVQFMRPRLPVSPFFLSRPPLSHSRSLVPVATFGILENGLHVEIHDPLRGDITEAFSWSQQTFIFIFWGTSEQNFCFYERQSALNCRQHTFKKNKTGPDYACRYIGKLYTVLHSFAFDINCSRIKQIAGLCRFLSFKRCV